MRAATKVAGIGAMTGGLRGAAAESLAARKAVRPASASVASSSATDQTGAGLKVEQAVQRPVFFDDWDFVGDDMPIVDRVGGDVTSPRVVFGAVPSIEEAREATSELKDALDQVYLSSPKSSGSLNSLSLPETKACVTHESSVQQNAAVQAFMLLKEDPKIESVVASIVSDPNVWNSVMNNPSLMEYFESQKKFAGAEVDVPQSPQSCVSSSHAVEPERPEGLMAIIEDMKLTVLDMVNSLSNFVQSLFAEPEMGKKPENSEGASRTVVAGGTFMALAMMVIMVIAMKRG